jgi:phosphoribosyl 1,2-cyclic phosphodiesterase
VGSISNDYSISVYTTNKVHNGIDRNYCVRKKIPSGCMKVIEKDVTFQLGEFNITPFEVPHDSSDNVGYKIVCGDVTFVLMTDIGHITEDMRQYISEANYLVIEANHDEEMLANGPYPEHLKVRIAGPNGHLSNSACGNALAEYATPELKHVWLCHLSEENNHPVLAQKTIETTLKAHGIIAGADFKLEVLKRKIPSEIFELI